MKQTAFILTIIILIIILTPGKSQSQVPANQQSIQDTAHLQSRDLKLVIATNASYGKVHKAGYSGVSELYMKTDNEKTPYIYHFVVVDICIFPSRSVGSELFRPK